MTAGGCADTAASALLRVAGLPIDDWLSAANPAVFDAGDRVAKQHRTYRTMARALAGEFGSELVPAPALTHSARSFVLAARRSLHRGVLMRTDDFTALAAAVVQGLGSSNPLLERTRTTAGVAESVRSLQAALTDDVQLEVHRLADAPWARVCESAIARQILSDISRPPYDDLLRPSADPGGGRQHRQRRRQRSDFLWRMIERAATDPTPRGWFAHVGLVRIAEYRSSVRTTIQPPFAPHWVERINPQRRGLLDVELAWSDDALRIGLSPLHRLDRTQLTCWVPDADDPSSLSEICIQPTAVVHAIAEMLANGSIAPPDLLTGLRRVCYDPPELLLGIVRHLAKLGVLQVSSPVREQLPRWSGQPHAIDLPSSGRTDVYRAVTSPISKSTLRGVQQDVALTLRLLAVMAADRCARPPVQAYRECRTSALDLVTDQLRDDDGPPAQHRRPGWSPAVTSGSGYAEILRLLAERMPARGEINISTEDLDEVGAPLVEFDWPVDCLVRPGIDSGREFLVLEQICHAGTLDARFAAALEALEGPVPAVQFYRSFLAEVERLTDIPFVEILVPPLTDKADNAVRRPRYTGRWTGDPDRSTYFGDAVGPSSYEPLAGIELVQSEDGLRAEIAGRRVWPVYHATRSPLPPWTRVVQTLLAAAPLAQSWAPLRLQDAIAAWPGREAMPRITIGSGLVLAPAQWRIPAPEFWQSRDPLAAKVAAVSALRRRYGLPRWVQIVDVRGGRHSADLSSLRSIPCIERSILGEQTPLLVTEMLPSPTEMTVRNPVGQRLSAELLFRLPSDESSGAIAARCASRIVESK